MTAQRGRFLPTLLDRLTDEAPESPTEVRRVTVGRGEYYEAVLRDLSWLLNSTRLDALVDLSGLGRVRASTLNYGLAPMSGRRLSELDLPAIAGSIREAILCFEPRIIRDSLSVTPVDDAACGLHNLVVFSIEARLWFEPAPLDLIARTEWDMEAGHVSVLAGHAGAPRKARQV